jgi:uncharacterized protein (DUF3820 family)
MMNRDEIVAKAAKMVPPKPKFGFGKYKGRFVETVLNSDPGYIVWAWRNVAKTYLPFGKEVYDKAYDLLKDLECEEDLPFDHMEFSDY